MPSAIIAIEAKPKRGPEFTIPDGLDLSGLKDDETKEILAVIKKADDGKACIISVDGIKLGEPDPEEVEEETDEHDDQSPPTPDQPFPQQAMAQARSAGLM